MPACLRETAGSASTTVLPATEPIVVTSSVSLQRLVRHRPEDELEPRDRRPAAEQALRPRRQHHAATAAADLLLLRLRRSFATTTITTSSEHGAADDQADQHDRSTRASVDRLELEVRLAERDHVVVDELVLAATLAVVDVACRWSSRRRSSVKPAASMSIWQCSVLMKPSLTTMSAGGAGADLGAARAAGVNVWYASGR